MNSFFYHLNHSFVNYITSLNNNVVGSFTSYYNKERPDIVYLFNSKFKNLLDDYISNYWVKYLFLFLFISFFFMEGLYFYFSLFENDHVGQLQRSGNTVMEFLNNIVILYDSTFFANLFSYFITLQISLLRYIVITYFTDISIVFLCFFLILCIFMLEVFTHKTKFSIFTFLFIYAFISFFFSFLSYFDLISIMTCDLIFLSIPLVLVLLLSNVNIFDLYFLGITLGITLLLPSFAYIFLLFIFFTPISFFSDLLKSVYEFVPSGHIRELIEDIIFGICVSLIYILFIISFNPNITFACFCVFFLTIIHSTRFFYKH